jgi:hypothetical protein
MKEYLMIFRNEKSENAEAPSEADMKEVMKQWRQWIQGIARKGNFSGTNRLSSDGKTLKPGNIVTDGPYIEAKEMIGGYVIVKTNSLEEAIEIAKECPNLTYGGNVEVRPVVNIDYDTQSDQFLETVK